MVDFKSFPVPWERVYGPVARDVAIDARNRIWILHRDKGSVFRLDENRHADLIGDLTGGQQIALTPGGTPWVCLENGDIYRLENGAWEQVPGSAVDVGISSDRVVYIIAAVDAGTNIVMRRVGNRWRPVPVEDDSLDPVRLDAGPGNAIWVCGRDGRITQILSHGKRNVVQGAARDIAVGGDGSVWHVGQSSQAFYKWEEDGWKQPDSDEGRGIAFAVSPAGVPVHCNEAGDIYIGPTFEVVPPHTIKIHGIRCITPSSGVYSNGLSDTVAATIGIILGTVATGYIVMVGLSADAATMGAATPITTGTAIGLSVAAFAAAEAAMIGLSEGLHGGLAAIGHTIADEPFLEFNGEKCWPDGNHDVMTAGEFRWINHEMRRTPDTRYTLDLYEYDYITSHDNLGSYEIQPSEAMAVTTLLLVNEEEGSVYALYVSATDNRNSDEIARDHFAFETI